MATIPNTDPDAALADTLATGSIRRMFERTLLTASRLLELHVPTGEGRMTREEIALCLRIIRGEANVGVADAHDERGND